MRCAPDRPARAVLRRWTARMAAVQRIGVALVVAAACVYLPANWLECWQAGRRVPVLNALVPGVRIEGPGNWGGYAAVYAFHVVLLFLGCMGTSSADMMLVLLVMHAAPMAEIFALRCAEVVRRRRRAAGRPMDGAAVSRHKCGQCECDWSSIDAQMPRFYRIRNDEQSDFSS